MAEGRPAEEALGDPRFYSGFDADGRMVSGNLSKIAGDSHYILEPHVVFEMNELLRYVTFRDRLAESCRSDQDT